MFENKRFCKRELKSIRLLARYFKKHTPPIQLTSETYIVYVNYHFMLRQQCPNGMCKKCFYQSGNKCNLRRRAIQLDILCAHDNARIILQLEQRVVANILEE